jgi:hypothetical protein
VSEIPNDKKLEMNARVIEESYRSFYLKTEKLPQGGTKFLIFGKTSNHSKDHVLVETRTRNVAYFVLEALRMVRKLTDHILKKGE